MLYNASLADMFSTDVTLTNKRTVKKTIHIGSLRRDWLRLAENRHVDLMWNCG